MKVNKKQFDTFFSDMKIEAVKPWRVTTSKTVHVDRKKEADRKNCRGKYVYNNR